MLNNQMADSQNELLSQRSPHNGIWLFALWSLIWHLEVSFDLSIRATINDYQREFCVWSIDHRGTDELPKIDHRGTDELPKLVLRFESGAFCVGRAFRIPLVDHKPQLARIWAAEMVSRYMSSQMSSIDEINGGDWSNYIRNWIGRTKVYERACVKY